MPTKTATKKKTTTNPPVKKKAATKTIEKKPATKKKALVKDTGTQKKSKPAKKKAISNTLKPTGLATETITHKKSTLKEVAVIEKANAKTKKLLNKLVEEPTESSLPPVEEKSPVINNPAIVAPGSEKSIQRAAVRNYVKKQIRLSSKKGGTKPAGKKPLW